MQRRSCEEIHFLISKYVDNEATPAEKARVDSHVAACDECRARLDRYREVEAIFASTPVRAAEPSLRVGLYREITHLKEEERRRERTAREARPWFLPGPSQPSSRRSRSRSPLVRLWSLTSPFVAATVALFAFLGLMNLVGPNVPTDDLRPDEVADLREEIIVVPTLAAPISSSAPPAEPTSKAGDMLMSPVVEGSATVYPTAEMAGPVIRLERETPVLEEGEVADRGSWHELTDPAHGYRAWYPPNWWTYTSGRVRYFYPWGPGGKANAPYWLELHVGDNPQGLTADTANAAMFGGNGTLYSSAQGDSKALRHHFGDTRNFYDEVYRFRPDRIYTLRAIVPNVSALGEFQERMSQAEDVFAGMSTRLRLTTQRAGAAPATGYGPTLFLNGTRLYSLSPDGRTNPLTPPNLGVRHFVLSPDMRTVAFTTAKNPADAWARSLYLVDLNDDGSPNSPAVLWDQGIAKIHDVVWYSDRTLIAIGQEQDQPLGIYRIDVRREKSGGGPDSFVSEIERLVELDAGMAGARGLAVAPDRQLISFLAPLGEFAGTDIYILRPNGSDLRRLVSHRDPVAPEIAGDPVLSPDSQAIKSYVWTDGRLEVGGYRFNILLTFGNASSPTLFRGGFLYSAPRRSDDLLLDHNTLGVADGTSMQVIHVAYSPHGKLALTGYYNDREGRADKLAGLWLADVTGGALSNVRALPMPGGSRGIADLQWSPDGRHLLYRETIPQSPDSLSARYDGHSPFRIVRLDTQTRQTETLFTRE